MTVRLDGETTVVLDALDFEARCEWPVDAAHAATLGSVCRACGEGALLCTPHLDENRDLWALAFSRGGQPACSRCRTQGRAYDEVFETVPL